LLEVVNLQCARGDRPLFRPLSFALGRGELLHLTGPNGAGKTTLLRTLCGLTHAVAGTIRWNGEEIRRLGDEYRQALAWVGHSNALQGELSPPENLRASAELAGGGELGRIDAILERLALARFRHFPTKFLSQGQQRRLALARLVLLRRPLWILDEPLSALDTASVAIIMELIGEHLSGSGLVVLTSHQELTVGFETLVSLALEAA